MNKEFNIVDESGLKEVVSFLLEILSKETQSTVVALSGDLGAGKTTFTKLLALTLGVKENVTSPTFVIQKRYEILNEEVSKQFQFLIHIDAYRLADGDDLKKLSFERLLTDSDGKNIICLEWPEIVPDMIPGRHIWIRFEHQEGNMRKVTVESKL